MLWRVESVIQRLDLGLVPNKVGCSSRGAHALDLDRQRGRHRCESPDGDAPRPSVRVPTLILLSLLQRSIPSHFEQAKHRAPPSGTEREDVISNAEAPGRASEPQILLVEGRVVVWDWVVASPHAGREDCFAVCSDPHTSIFGLRAG